MHVLVIPSWYPTPYMPVAGVFFRDQVRALAIQGITVGVVYPDLRSLKSIHRGHLCGYRFQIAAQLENSIPVVRYNGWRLPKIWLFNRWLWITMAEKLFKKYLRAFGKPDLIHAHSVMWAGEGAAVLSDKYKLPFVITEHFSGFITRTIHQSQKQFLKPIFDKASALMAVSRNLIERIQPYVPGKPIHAIPNIVQPLFFRDRPSIPRLKASCYRFLTVSLLTPNKGVDVLLQAFAAAFKGNQDVVLEIGGDGPKRRQLRQLVSMLGIDNQVAFSGMLRRDQVREAFWRSDCFVLSSYFETFGLVLAEAMATGLPVISTKSGGPEEFVNNATGLLVPKGDVQVLSEALRWMYDRRLYWENRSSFIRQYAFTNFSESAVVTKLLKIYEKILDE